MISFLSNVDHPVMAALWERSVRASHDFLSDSDIAEIFLKLPKFFNAVELRGWRNQNEQLLGFIGLAEKHIEMLFVDADAIGQGIGKALLEWARLEGANKVDVNEQNPKALNFYQHLGFVEVSRSEMDGQGRPFPIIHLEMKTNCVA